MPIVFLTQSLLAGLVLGAVPILIHLISRRRARRVSFAAIEFVLRSKRRTTRSVQLRQLLLLSTRVLFLLAIVLAAARPLFQPEKAATKTKAPLAVVLVLDQSASMNATLDGHSAFDRSQQMGVKILRELPDDVRVGAIGCDATPASLNGPASFLREALLTAWSKKEVLFESSDLTDCVARAQEMAESVPGVGERRVVVLSDLAAHAFVSDAPSKAQPGLVVQWRPSFDELPPPNSAIQSVALQNTSPDQVHITAQGNAETLTLQYTVARFGADANATPIDLLLDQHRAARQTLDLKDAQPLNHVFTHTFLAAPRQNNASSPGQKLSATKASPLLARRATLQLPDDALTFDNSVEVPVNLPKPVRVLVVDGAPQPVPFLDEAYYLESALNQSKSSHAQLQVKVVGPAATTAHQFSDADVVVLANVARLEPALSKALIDFVKSGGGLFVTVGDQTDVAWSNRALGDVLPGRLRGAKGQKALGDSGESPALRMTDPATNHPIFAGLTTSGGRLSGLALVRTHTSMLLEPDEKGLRKVLLHFDNGAPALLERRVERGRTLLLATTVDRDWTDLPIRPGYLPLMQQCILHLAGALFDAGPVVVRVGEPRALLLPPGATSLRVTDPSGQRVILRQQDVVTQKHPDGSRTMRYEATNLPGLYSVESANDGAHFVSDPRDRFTVMVAPQESDLRRATPQQLSQATPVGAISKGGHSDQDQPLWPWLLGLAVLLLLGESALLRKG